MSEAILGVDIAKRKFDVALLINGKLKHKVFSNNQEGFEELELWSRSMEQIMSMSALRHQAPTVMNWPYICMMPEHREHRQSCTDQRFCPKRAYADQKR